MNKDEQFRVLVLNHLNSLYNYARILTAGGSSSEDLVQDTLLRAFRSFDGLKPGMNPKPWLFAIMRNAHIDQYRRQGQEPPIDHRPDVHDSDFTGAADPDQTPLDPEGILIQRVAIEAVREAMRRLPHPCREVVELREIEGLSYQEIAEVIRRPIGTVMSRLYRGRNLLRTMLRHQSPSVPEQEHRRDL